MRFNQDKHEPMDPTQPGGWQCDDEIQRIRQELWICRRSIEQERTIGIVAEKLVDDTVLEVQHHGRTRRINTRA